MSEQKKVYIVIWKSDESWDILAVFSNREAAEKYIQEEAVAKELILETVDLQDG